MFRITLSGEFTVLHAFGGSGARRPLGALIQAADGYLYGTTASVFRPSTGAWYILGSSTAVGIVTLLGVGTDAPVPADYDGDGKADVTVFRAFTGTWFINQSSTLLGSTITWGAGADAPVLK